MTFGCIPVASAAAVWDLSAELQHARRVELVTRGRQRGRMPTGGSEAKRLEQDYDATGAAMRDRGEAAEHGGAAHSRDGTEELKAAPIPVDSFR